MEENNKEEYAYKKYQVPRLLNIKGYDITFKNPPLSGEIFRYRCWTNKCNYFIKINHENITKLLNKEKEVEFEEVNSHTNHKEVKNIIKNSEIKTEEEIKILTKVLIKMNLKEPLNFHIENLKNNKVNLWP